MQVALKAPCGLRTVEKFLIGLPVTEKNALAIIEAARSLGFEMPRAPWIAKRGNVDSVSRLGRFEA
jgi:hypothetical protein